MKKQKKPNQQLHQINEFKQLSFQFVTEEAKENCKSKSPQTRTEFIEEHKKNIKQNIKVYIGI